MMNRSALAGSPIVEFTVEAEASDGQSPLLFEDPQGAVATAGPGSGAPSALTGPDVQLDLPSVTAYVRSVAAALGLSDWDLSVDFDGGMDDASARVEAPAYQKRANVLFGSAFLTETAEARRDTVVHEMTHLILMNSWKFVDELLDQEMPSRVARVAWLGYVSHVEAHIDHLAALLSPGVPLPPELVHSGRPGTEGSETRP